MLAELGYIYLIVAFTAAVLTAAISLAAIRTTSPGLIKLARNSIFLTAAVTTLAIGVILSAFINKDFDFQIVVRNASTDLPGIYSFTALYADKAGSLLFWGWLLSLAGALLILQKHRKSPEVTPFCVLVLAVIQSFFLAMVTFVANVFEKSAGSPVEGLGMNPQLQNLGMLIHPPLLYLGFSGFMVVFAFVAGAVVSRGREREWAADIRRWALFAWCALGLGNLVGAWWAYTELGWGGYWTWDAVENAGLMPWLLGTAFIHSIAMVRKRNYLQKWSLALITFTFVFVLLSPFITHGGIESIVHGFSGSPFPPYILGLIIFTLAGAVCLRFRRQAGIKRRDRPASLVSAEGAFLLTNILLTVLVILIITGTIYPRISGIWGEKTVLERDFFDFSCGPILLILVFFMGICYQLGWKKSSWSSLVKRSAFPAAASLTAAIAIISCGIGNWYALAALVCGFPVFSFSTELFVETRRRYSSRRQSRLTAFPALVWSNRPRYGGAIVHTGIILITLGVIGSSMYDVERTETLSQGESLKISGYELVYDTLSIEESGFKINSVASVSVFKDGSQVDTLYPKKIFWFNRGQSFAEVAIRTTPLEDLFVALLNYESRTDSITIKAAVKPLIIWMWIGGGFILLGGIMAFWPERKRLY
ncbi:MAG: cytochrome c-type biogenesis CcmF C-terminal domain-containing protein [Dehalococcoidia bacterium]